MICCLFVVGLRRGWEELQVRSREQQRALNGDGAAAAERRAIEGAAAARILRGVRFFLV